MPPASGRQWEQDPAIPIEGALEEVLEAYLVTRPARSPRHDLDHPAALLFVDVCGGGLSVDQAKTPESSGSRSGRGSAPPPRGFARWCEAILVRWRSENICG